MRSFVKFMFFGALAAGTLVAPPAAGGQALRQPEGWRTRAERFVAMPPGFHITTSPSVLFYRPDARAEGEYSVESEGFLFRGDSPNTYGVFVGGRDLDNDDAAWTSFEIGHDGRWVVRTRQNRGDAQGAVITDLAGPAAGPVALPGEDATAKNVLAVHVGADDVAFVVNGETVTRLARAGLPVDGVVGFRVGAGLNLHLTTLSVISGDAIRRYAPERPDATEGGGA